MKKEKFHEGQRVKRIDPDEEILFYGTIKEIRERSIIIIWDDVDEPCKVFPDEYDSIFDGQSKMI